MNEPSGSLANAQRVFAAGDHAAAKAACLQRLADEPADVAALDLCGRIELADGRPAEALHRFEQAIGASARTAEFHLHRAQALQALGRRQEAIAALRTATAAEPGLAEAHHELGNALKRLGRFAEAVTSLREASRLLPTDAAAWLNLGAALLELGRPNEAIPCFRRGIELEPQRVEARNILGAALADGGLLTEAETVLRAALAMRSDYAAARNNLARVLKAQGRVEAAAAEYRASLAAQPDTGTHSNLVYALNFLPNLTPDAVFAEHQAWAERHESPLLALRKPAPPRGASARPLRVGFVSPDFINHAVAYFFEPLLANRERGAWWACCYSDARVPDRVTQRLRGLADGWHDTATLSDEALAERIRRDRIDILVDLSGHTARNRLTVFARKPAPVQVTWLGYPNTTGLSSIDYRITDALADPEGRTDRWHSERLVRLPRCFLCYQAPAESPKTAGDVPSARTGYMTFGSFSNYAKLSEPCVDTWAALLNRVPGSRLKLKSRGLGDAGVAAAARGRFERRGVAGDRIELDGSLVGTAEHLAQYRAVDVALDPFPYNGTTTTCEALWMGVPVVTLAGATHVARVGVSLLTNIGHPEWIADSPGDYIERAAALAEDCAKLGRIRASVRRDMAPSALCDGPGFARELQRVFEGLLADAT